MHPAVSIRRATPDDFVPVMRVLEGALLEVDAADVRQALRDEADSFVLVGEREDRVVGSIYLDRDGEHAHVEAVAVVRSHRGEGIGSALVDAADERLAADAALSADFEERVRPFYESLGFEIEERDGRLWGRR